MTAGKNVNHECTLSNLYIHRYLRIYNSNPSDTGKTFCRLTKMVVSNGYFELARANRKSQHHCSKNTKADLLCIIALTLSYQHTIKHTHSIANHTQETLLQVIWLELLATDLPLIFFGGKPNFAKLRHDISASGKCSFCCQQQQ